ncbi:MAG: ATP-binding protein, partial [Melioribacteraceae bacterium]|nr:ATP-binding protein [Melioribacteraceae bacterium]
DHLGLIDAIDWQIKEFQKRNNITCNINISKNLNIDKEKSIAIFRIIQELLLNVSKHSKATILNFEFVKNENTLNIVVEDNGVGFKQEEIQKPNSMGLINIFECVKILDGKISINSKLNNGTKVEINLPLNNNQI